MLFKYINWALLLSVVIIVTAVPPPKPQRHSKPNLPKWMDSERTNEMAASDFSHNEFHTSLEIYEQLERIGKLGGNVKLRNMTNKLTVMEREIKLVTIQAPVKDYDKGKPTIFVAAGVHGRDWYSVAAAMNLIHELTVNSDDNSDLTDDFNWWIAPLVNPDGYNLSMSNCFRGFTVRDWRKNCEHNYTFLHEITAMAAGAEDPYLFNHTVPQLFRCGGVDPERNFEYQWINYDYKLHVNATMCDKLYPGPTIHSAVEADPLIDLLGEENEAHVTLFINIREGGSTVAYPYCYTKREPIFKSDAEELTKKAAKSGLFSHGQSSHLFPLHAGAMEDYMEAHFGIRNSISLFIKEHRNSKALTRGSKIKVRSRRAFKTIRELAKSHKTYADDSSGGGGGGGGGGGVGRSHMGRSGKYRPYLAPGGLAVRRRSGGAATLRGPATLLVSLLCLGQALRGVLLRAG